MTTTPYGRQRSRILTRSLRRLQDIRARDYSRPHDWTRAAVLKATIAALAAAPRNTEGGK